MFKKLLFVTILSSVQSITPAQVNVKLQDTSIANFREHAIETEEKRQERIRLTPIIVQAGEKMFEIVGQETVVEDQIQELKSLLREYPTIVNQRFQNFDTALIKAVKHKNKMAMQILIEANANLNLRNTYDATALLLAISQKDESLTKMIINAGADIKQQDKLGNTPLMHAMKTGFDTEYQKAVKARQEMLVDELNKYMIPELSKISIEYQD